MAITLASTDFGDAEVTDNIGHGEVGSAALLWVRYWPTALAAARQYVEPAEVPGLAAEALIGTIAAIAIGRGPREDVAGFLTAAVRELGEDDLPVPDPALAARYPDVFRSPMLTSAFAELDGQTQRNLRTLALDHHLDDDGARALTVLQHYYLAEHADRAESAECRRPHIALMAVVEGSTKVIPGDTWLHLSACAWCTEAFHEVAFSNVELGALIDPAVLNRVSVLPPTPVAVASEPAEVPVAAVATASVPDEVDEDDEPHRGRRGRLVAAIAVAAASLAVVVALLHGGDDGTTPAAAATTPSTTSTSSPAAIGVPGTLGASLPTTVTSAPVPSGTATARPTSTPTTETQKPTTKPTRHSTRPTPRPTSSAPGPSAPASTPAPSPSATPTKTCNGLQHLLGLC